MEASGPITEVRPYWTPAHAGSVAALGPDARAFFAVHGYNLARLARRNRVSAEMMSAFFAGRTSSRRLVRNLTKLRAQLDARAGGAGDGMANPGD